MKLDNLLEEIHNHQVNDWKQRNVNKMEIDPTSDWAIKRMNSILREVEHLGVEIIELYGNCIKARWKELPLIGMFNYETRNERPHYTSRWTRPRIALRFWVESKVKGYSDLWENGYLTYKGDGINHWPHKRNIGGETLEIVFGNKRMMVYNRLMPATLNCMGKIK